MGKVVNMADYPRTPKTENAFQLIATPETWEVIIGAVHPTLGQKIGENLTLIKI
jgi:hypothetical protein